MKNKVVIIGAGYAGILTAKNLANGFKNAGCDASVTIIDKNPFHTMLTELHEVAANRVDEDSIRIDLGKVFAGRKVDVKLDTVTSVDFESRKVIGEKEEYPYDFLVLAAGSKPTFFGVEGAKENAFKLWSYDDAIKLQQQVLMMFRRACVETDPEIKSRLLTFFVVGAGFTGVEMIGELAEYVPILCEKFNIPRDQVKLFNVDMLKRTVPNLPEKLSAKVEKRLEKMGVTVLLETHVVAVGKDYIEIKQGDETTRTPADTVIWAAGIESADITTLAAGTLESTGKGRINVDPYLRAVGHEEVYVAGDNIFYIPEGEDAPVPQVVENSEQSADTVAENILCEVLGDSEMLEYKPKFHGLMVSIGGRYGVARVGTATKKINLPSFLAMFVKHFVNVIYFIRVAGYNKVISYLRHEFFTIRHNRSFLGGHFSNRTPSFLLLPLRVWLGMVWIFEGIMKIVEGWFKEPMLSSTFAGASNAFKAAFNSGSDAVSSATAAAAAAPAADATSSATSAATDAATTLTPILQFDLIGLFHVMFMSMKELAVSTINDYALKVDVPILNGMMNATVLASDTSQIVMQTVIVCLEIIVGALLIVGLFNTPASAISIVLQLMFLTTTGVYLGTFWMLVAGVALLIRGGGALGLDYYVMPRLKERWKNVRIARKLYLYND